MSTTIHAFDYLDQPPPPAHIQVIFGDEPFLRRLVLKRMRDIADPAGEAPAAMFDGDSVAWRDVHDELCTVSLFNPSGPRTALVDDADTFVSENRDRLEDYLEQPRQHGVLILSVSKWASNTRLYKLTDKHGIQVECRLPQTARGKQKVVDQGRVIQWLTVWGKQQHGVQMTRNAATLLWEMLGPELGLLDQELAKLALYTGPAGRIDEGLIEEHAGGWRAKTAWDLMDAALQGDTATALQHLDRLLQGGDHPNALFGPISWSLRRFAVATRIFQRAWRHGRRLPLPEVLVQAGFFKWQVEALKRGEQQLKQLGQERAGKLHRWLLETDLALKGSHSAPDMARLALEHLLLRLDKQLAPARAVPGSNR